VIAAEEAAAELLALLRIAIEKRQDGSVSLLTRAYCDLMHEVRVQSGKGFGFGVPNGLMSGEPANRQL
jgi:hypothetical protein